MAKKKRDAGPAEPERKDRTADAPAPAAPEKPRPQRPMSPQASPASYGMNMPNLMPQTEHRLPLAGGIGMASAMEEPAPNLADILAPDDGGLSGGPIGEREAQEALKTLEQYRAGKAQFEKRIIREEQWYKLQHGVEIQRGLPEDIPKPTTAWLLSTIMSKHADMMDNAPEPVILPREQSDEQSAKVLSDVIPVILERADFLKTYSDNCWDKAKFGTCCYGIFWDSTAENGLGEITVKPVDLLNIFWEPGVRDVQDSRNLFIVSMVDNDTVDEMFPEQKEKLRSALTLNQYRHEDTLNNHDKTAIVDWYYKRHDPSGRTVLHFAKLIGDHVLFSSENDGGYPNGWYEHGEYPVVFDTLFPQKDTVTGFGYISENMDTQLYIDKLSGYILDHAALSARQRYWIKADGGVNEEEFLENRKLVHVAGSMEEDRLRAIDVPSMGSYPIEVLRLKIDEIKETSSNRDFGNGGTMAGVTAASAIYALQESGNKVSRDSNQQTYRVYAHIVRQIIELVRQFYDEPRVFRIVQPNGAAQFVPLDNSGLKDQPNGFSPMGEELVRKPIFDIKVSAQKRNPFSTAAQNEQAMQLYGAGFFAPEQAQASSIALDMMEFEGKDKVLEKVLQGQTLFNIIQQMQAQMNQMAMAMGIAPAGAPQQEEQQEQGGGQRRFDIPQKAAEVERPRSLAQMKRALGNG